MRRGMREGPDIVYICEEYPGKLRVVFFCFNFVS